VAAKVRVPPAAALRRERLHALLGEVWTRRLAVVVAPAGSGKTTLLSQFAGTAGCPVAWYRAETWDADERTFLRHLEAALGAALPDLAGDWSSVEAAAAAIEAGSGERALLVIDDAHELEGTEAETALGRLVEYAPPWLAIAVGSRLAPGLNLSRLRVAGRLVEIGPEELRFRAWEVERLFREHYADPVAPEDLAVLARRTEGWAAGLQLFHLATRGKSADERRRILTAVGSSSRLVREYLTWNVMADLPEELRDFLVDTCVLGRLTGELCDRLLDRRGSRAMLEELFRRRIFTVELDEADGSYRYHEVFRSHLDRTLVERIGEAAARDRYRAAGALLEEAGAPAEALGAYSRAEDWTAVRRLLGGQGERLVDGASAWLERLPPAIVRNEPWLELAAARRARAEGRWSDAVEAYARAEAGFGASSIALVCVRERQALRTWFEPVTPGPVGDWTRLLRAGIGREPLAAAREAARHEDVPQSFVRGVMALAAGEVERAAGDLAAARDALGDRPVLAALSGLALAVAQLLNGDPTGALELDRAEEAAERADAPWLARLARAANRLVEASAGPLDDAVAATFDPERDPWGAAIAALFEAWAPGPGDTTAPPIAERRIAAAERAAGAFRKLGAGVPEAWARGLAALGLAESGSPEAREAASSADSLARAAGTPGVRLVTYGALAIADEGRRSDHEQLAEAVRRETGLTPPPSGIAPSPVIVPPSGATGAGTAADDAPSFRVRAFGGFEMDVAGRSVGLDAIRPRARSLLRFLAVNAGSGIHREVIAAALWPEADAQTSARSLQVAVSAVRGVFTELLGADGGRLLVREGDAYRLAIPAESVDLRRFERAVADARAARARGNASWPALGTALGAYGGEVLPEEGPADWAVELREHHRKEAVEVAREAAEAALLAGEPRAAIDACRAGLAIDRFHDPLWRLLIEARQVAGDVSAADRDRREYEAILVELGVPSAAAAIAAG
jgi:DNA-binding SARP family transcriptional activator